VQRDEATADVAVVTEDEIADVIGRQNPVLPDDVDDASVAVGQPAGELRERVTRRFASIRDGISPSAMESGSQQTARSAR